MCRAAIELYGKVVSELDTGDMVFGIAKTIAEITRSTTLVPGDEVEVAITGLGTLRNPVRSAGR